MTVARSEIDQIIADGLAEHDEAVGARWEQIRIEPALWQCSPWGDADGGFWAVAIAGDQVLWFNEIEEGFNWSDWSRCSRRACSHPSSRGDRHGRAAVRLSSVATSSSPAASRSNRSRPGGHQALEPERDR